MPNRHTCVGFLLHRNVKRLRGGLVSKAHRLEYHSTLGWRVIKKKTKHLERLVGHPLRDVLDVHVREPSLGFRV